MAERKVLNKYIPPDYDPDLMMKNRELLRKHGYMSDHKTSIRKDVLDLNPKLMNIRMMFPFTFCCSSCKDFTYVGTKFNSRAEKLYEDTYLGIVKWRFYAKCPNCKAPIVFKTDPKHGDYTLESGGIRTYDPNRDAILAAGELKKTEEEEQQEEEDKIMHKANIALKEYQDYERLAELKRVAGRAQDRELALTKALFDVQKDDNEPSIEIIENFKLEQENMLKKILNLNDNDEHENEHEHQHQHENDNINSESIEVINESESPKIRNQTKHELNSNLSVSIKKKQKVSDLFSGYDSN